VSRPRRGLDRDAGQHVHRVARENDGCVGRDAIELVDDLGGDARIGAEKVEATLTRDARRAGRDDHNVGAAKIGVIGRRRDLHLGEQRYCVGDVPGLPFGPRRVTVV
jgi:hypothetical protein